MNRYGVKCGNTLEALGAKVVDVQAVKFKLLVECTGWKRARSGRTRAGCTNKIRDLDSMFPRTRRAQCMLRDPIGLGDRT